MSVQTSGSNAGARIRTELPGPNARRILEGDKAFISPSYTRSYPLVARKGRGIIVEDVDGNEFLDFSAGIAVVSTGHCHPHVVEAIQKQAADLIHMSGTDFYYESLVTVAERLSQVMPMPGPHRFYYGNSGAEAIEAAIKVSRYHTRRQNIIAFYGAFHGRTMGALSLTASKPQQRRRFFPVVPGVTHVPFPDLYRRPAGADARRYAIDCARFIEDTLFRTTLPPEEVAAIFVEPLQGEGGYRVAPAEFLREIRSICDRYGILMVVDEVQSGAGRTGKWWAIQHSGVEPDIVCVAKGIASGMPLSVTVTRAEIMDWTAGSHASTFGGNPVSLAAALATIDILSREGIRNAEAVGRHIMDRIRSWPQKHALVGDVRGLGLMIGVDLVTSKDTREPAGPVRDRVIELAFQRGCLFLGAGPSSIRICPPLIITKEQADAGLDILEECLALAERTMEPAAGPGKPQGS